MEPEELKRFGLFSDFGDEDREHLVELLDEKTVGADQTIFAEGDEADAMILVVSGSVRIHSQAVGPLALLCAGANLGCVSLVSVGKREASAISESETRLASLDRAGFLRLAEDHPRTACRLAQAMLSDLASTLRARLPQVKQQFSTDVVVLSG